MTEQEKNRKLTEWSDAEEYFTDEEGCPHRKIIQFFQSLDACFKWLVPKLEREKYHISLIVSYAQLPLWELVSVDYKHQYRACAETPALALCLAILKLIDGA